MKKALWKRMLRWILWCVLTFIILVFVGLGVVVNFIFTPSRLTPIVEKTATEFLNAEIKFGRIELTFFSTFPDFGLQISDATVISKSFRDSTQTADSVPGHLILAQDSLMSIKSCLITMNPMAYLVKNKIVIKDFLLDEPQIYAYVDQSGLVNWDIVKATTDTLSVDSTTPDSSSFNSSISLHNVRIRQGSLIFDDRSTELYTRLTGLNLGIEGDFASINSKLKVDFLTENILLWQKGALLVKRLKLGIDTEMQVNRDSLLYTLDRAVFNVNGVRFGAGGTLKGDAVNRTLMVDLKYGIHIPSLKTILDLVPNAVLKKTDDVDVRGEVTCQGEINGLYGRKRIPKMTTEVKIKGGYIAYSEMPSQIDTLELDLYAMVDLQKEQESYVDLRHFYVKGGGIDVKLKGGVKQLLSAPVVNADLKSVVNFSDLTKIFPLADGMTCQGVLNASLSSKMLVSDVMTANYGKINVEGDCRMQDVEIFIPKDSIVVNVASAGLVFASNSPNSKTLQKKDLLNGIIGYSGLKVHIQNKVTLSMDTTYMTLNTSPLHDTSAIVSMSSNLSLGRMVVIVRDTLLLGLKKADLKVSLQPWKKNKKIPQIRANIEVDSLRLGMLGNRLNLAKAAINLRAVRSLQNEKIWRPSGSIDFMELKAYSPYFPVRFRMPGTRLHFNANDIQLDSAVLKLGHSDMKITGRIQNLAKAFLRKDTLQGELLVTSKQINCNQLMKALEAGNSYAAKVEAGYKETIGIDALEDDIDAMPIISDTINTEGSTSLFIIPPGIDFTFQTDIKQVLIGQLKLENIYGEVVMRNQCIELSDLRLRSSAANMRTTAIYKATDTLTAYTGFNLKMFDIQIDSLVTLIPALDSLFPMLRSFSGTVDFNIAADGRLDPSLMIDLESLRGAAYLDGRDLVLMDGETFSEISKMLMFKNKKRNLIDSISVNMSVKNGAVEIFPFMVSIDRYKAAIGGVHHMDMTFKYHISILKSPLPFRAGLNISGDLDDMKFRITKAKYKDLFIPSRRAKVDSTQLNLQKQIRKMLENPKQ